MADVITSGQAVLQEDVVNERVLSVLTATAVMAGSAVDDYTSTVGPGMDRTSIPKYGNWTVQKKTPGTPIDAATNAFTEAELLLDENAVIQFLLEKRAELQSKIAIATKYIDQGAADMAVAQDLDILTEMYANGTAQSLATVGTLDKADILDAANKADVAKWSPMDRFCVVHPDEKYDLLGLPEFTRVNEAGSNRALRNGEIGELFGFTFLMSPVATAGSPIFYQKTGIAFARQQQLEIDSDKDLSNLATRWSLDMLYGQQVTDAARVYVYS